MSIKDTAKLASLKNTEQRIAAIAQQQEPALTPVTYQGHDPQTGTSLFSKSGDCCADCSTISGGALISTGGVGIGDIVMSRPTEGMNRLDTQPITSSPSECGSAGSPSPREVGGGASTGGLVTTISGYVCPKGQVKAGSYKITGTTESYEIYTGNKITGLPIDGFPKQIWQVCETELITNEIPPENFPIFREGEAFEGVNYCGGLPHAQSVLTWSNGGLVSSGNPPIRYAVNDTPDGIEIDWGGGTIDTYIGATSWEIWDLSSWTGLIQYDIYLKSNDALLYTEPNWDAGGVGVLDGLDGFFLDGASFNYVTTNSVTNTKVQDNTFFTPSGTKKYRTDFGSIGDSHQIYVNTQAGYAVGGGSLNNLAYYYFAISNLRLTTQTYKYGVYIYYPNNPYPSYIERVTSGGVPVVSLLSAWDVYVYDANGQIFYNRYSTEPTDFRYSCRSTVPRKL